MEKGKLLYPPCKIILKKCLLDYIMPKKIRFKKGVNHVKIDIIS